MTSQEKKAWLMRYKELDKEINRELDELTRLKAMCEKVTATYSDVPMRAPGKAASKEDVYVRMVDLMDKINRKIDLFVDMRGEIERAIHTVDDPTLRLLLKLRYLDGKKWEQIAVELGYDYRWTLRLHGRALERLKTPLKATIAG